MGQLCISQAGRHLLSQHHPISKWWLHTERSCIALGLAAHQCAFSTNLPPQHCPHLSMENKEKMQLEGESTTQMCQVPLLLSAPLVSKLHRLPVIQTLFAEQKT